MPRRGRGRCSTGGALAPPTVRALVTLRARHDAPRGAAQQPTPVLPPPLPRRSALRGTGRSVAPGGTSVLVLPAGVEPATASPRKRALCPLSYGSMTTAWVVCEAIAGFEPA